VAAARYPYFAHQVVDKPDRTYLQRQLALVNSQDIIAQLVLFARDDGVRVLAMEKCTDMALLDDMGGMEEGSSREVVAAVYQRWFLNQCAEHGIRDNPGEMARWLAAGRDTPPECLGEMAQRARCFRSVPVVDERYETDSTSMGMSYGSTLVSSRTTTTYDLGNIEDHFMYFERQSGAVDEAKLLACAVSDRKQRGSAVSNRSRIKIVEHKDWNKWMLNVFPYKRPRTVIALKDPFF